MFLKVALIITTAVFKIIALFQTSPKVNNLLATFVNEIVAKNFQKSGHTVHNVNI